MIDEQTKQLKVEKTVINTNNTTNKMLEFIISKLNDIEARLSKLESK